MSEPIKTAKSEIWFFDIETAPCIDTGRKVYDLSPLDISCLTDADVLEVMYENAGATDKDPQPMLKSVFQRVVAISAVVRKFDRATGAVELSIHSLPTGEISENVDEFDERRMIERFLMQLGARKPQIVGYNHSGFDIPTLFQRAIVHGIDITNFCVRPEKPWDPVPDYFNDKNDWNVDLKNVIGSWGKAAPKLTEIARACGIPAKIGGEGSEVADMWFAGKRREIVNYCEGDVLTTYLLWLRTARASGLINSQTLFDEDVIFRQMLEDGRAEKPHLGEFLDQLEANEKVMEVAA